MKFPRCAATVKARYSINPEQEQAISMFQFGHRKKEYMAEENKQNQSQVRVVLGILLVAVAAMAGAVLLNYATDTSTEPSNVSVEQVQLASNEDGTVVDYTGVEGESALALLKQYADVDTDEFEGLGEYVVAINGVTADSSSNYWAFYVNGEAATVGAGSYVTASGDQIEWRLESVETFDQ